MKTLPSIPKSIPAHIRAEAKAKGVVYVGIGTDPTPIFPKRVDCFFWEVGNEHLVEEFSVNGSSPCWHYFVTPKVAAKYFTLPKKTPAYTRGAKGRFASPKPTAAQAKKEEKPRRPKQGEVWRSDYGMDHLVARVSFDTALLISVCSANRKNERALKLDSASSVENDQNLTFVAASLAEYFKNKY